MREDKTDWLDFVERLEAEESKTKNTFLARVAYQLTIRARDAYEPGTSGLSAPERLRAVNEVMHRLTQRLLKLSSGNDNDRNEREFWVMLAEIAQQGSCLDDLVSAVSKAASVSAPA